jgi:hypothetical protein
MMAKKKKVVWQKHHLTYEPRAIIVRVRRSEHYVITLLDRFSALTRGAKKAIRYIARTKPDFQDETKTTKTLSEVSNL